MRRKLPLSLAIAVTALALTACSASDVGTSADGGVNAASSSENPDVKEAQAELDKYSEIPAFKPPNDAFDISSLKGKRIAIVALNQTTPALVSMIKAVENAAEVAGLRTSLYDAKGTPSEMTAGIAQAVSTHADGIILAGIPTGLVSKQLADASAAKIPVIAGNNNQPDVDASGQGAGEGVYAVAAPDYTLNGKLAAAAAVAKAGGEAKAVLITTDGIDPAPAVLKGIRDGLAACSTCKVLDTRHVQLEDWFNGNLASLTTSLVTKYPNANVFLPILSTMALPMMPAAQQAGAGNKITFFTTSAPPDIAKLFASTANLGGLAGASDEHVGWLALNQVMRGMLGLEPGDPAVPVRYITAETTKKTGTSYAELYGTAYKDGFKKIWGLR